MSITYVQLTDAEREYLDGLDPADKADCFDALMGAYAALGHQEAYLKLDRMFEGTPLMLPWQRKHQATKEETG